MNSVLVIGSGCREAIIVRKLLDDSKKLGISLNVVCIGTSKHPFIKENCELDTLLFIYEVLYIPLIKFC